MQTSLKSRVFRAGRWTLAGFFFRNGIRFGSSLLMTRLLIPEMFGVMAIASLVLAGLAMFSDLGLRQSVVQSKRGEEALFLNTVWIVQIFRGFLLWFIACILSLAIVMANSLGVIEAGSVYATAELPFVIVVVSVGVMFSGFESTKVFEANRHLLLDRLIKIDITTQLASFLCMLAWVAFERTIWALVAGSVISSLLRAIFSHTHLVGTNNRWQWDSAAFREIASFGKWVFTSSIFSFFANNGDRILLGALVNSTVLGTYAIAFLIYEAIEQLFTRILFDVSFPALSQIVRERRNELKNTYYKFHLPIASLAYFVSGALMMAGPDLINVLYDERYQDAGWMLSILAIAIINIPTRLADQSFLALGMPKLLSNITMLRLFALYTFVPVGFYNFGLVGAIFGVTFSQFLRWPIIIFYGKKLTLLDMRRELVALPFLPIGVLAGFLFKMAVRKFV